MNSTRFQSVLRRKFVPLAAGFLALTAAGLEPIDLDALGVPFPAVRSAFAAKRPVSQSKDADFFAKISFEMQGVELLDFLQHYAESLNFTLFIDRRVDPTTRVSGSNADEPFIVALGKILGDVNLSFCVVDSTTLYIGPAESAGEMLLLLSLKSEGLEDAPKQVQTKLSTPLKFTISPFSEPREVFKAYAQQTRLKLAGFDKTPFDLWRGAEFNGISSGTLLTILGIGFNVDYKYDVDSASLKPVAIDRDAVVTRHYPSNTAKSIDKTQFSNCDFEETLHHGASVVRVTGPFRDIAQIEILVSQNLLEADSEKARVTTESSSSRGKLSNKKIQISGEVSNKTLRDLFDYLEKNANVVCLLDDSIESEGVTLETRVSCKFNNADQAQIASTIAKKINAAFELDGNSITFLKK